MREKLEWTLELIEAAQEEARGKRLVWLIQARRNIEDLLDALWDEEDRAELSDADTWPEIELTVVAEPPTLAIIVPA